MASSKKDRQFMQKGAAQAAAMLRTVGNEHRLLVLCLLIEHGELAVNELLEYVDLSQSALSQHLAKMREEGLVTYRREAQALYYRIGNSDVEKLVAALKKIFCP
jgi:DNA-binding transcriptional ArsR family regulator